MLVQIRRKVLRLAIPAIVSNLLYTFQNIVDTIMLGHYKDPQVSLSAVGIGGMFYFLMFPLIMGITTGGVAMIARRWGEENYSEAKRIFNDLHTLLILIAIPIAFFAVFFGWTLPVALGAGHDVVIESYRYMMAVFTFYPFAVFMAVYHSSMRAAGDTKTPMMIDIVANSWNILWDFTLIYGEFGFPELGVMGAGIAPGSSYLAGSFLYLILQKRGKLVIFPDLLSRARVRMETVKTLFRIGIPAGIERGMWSITSLIYTALIFAVSNSLGYSAFQVGLRAESLAYMPGFGFSIAATTLVGQYLGAKKSNEARKSAMEAAKMCAMFMGFAGLLMVLFPTQIAMLFTDDPEIVRLASIYLFMMGFTEPALGILFTLAGGMRGAGYTTMPMIINLSGLFGIRLGLAIIFAFPLGLGLVGIWLGMFFETFIRAAWMYLEFHRGKWARVKV